MWTGGSKTLSVRINGLDTPFWYRDVVDLLEQAGDRLDQIMIPKAGCAADIYAVDALVTGVEAAKGRTKPHQLRGDHRIRRRHRPCRRDRRRQPQDAGAAAWGRRISPPRWGWQTTGIGGTQESYYMLRDGTEILV